MPGISPKLPLQVDVQDGPYRLTKTVSEALTQDLKMIILTNPGERVMDPNFGAGILSYLFDNFSPSVYDEITDSIQEQVSIYLPQVNIEEVKFHTRDTAGQDLDELVESNVLAITIRYSIPQIDESLVFTLPVQ
jgi:phage baseplate assembly protein W